MTIGRISRVRGLVLALPFTDHVHARAIARVTRSVATILALATSGALLTSAATQSPSGNPTATNSSKSGRAPSFPETLESGYVPVAPNTLGITMMFLNYPNTPNAQPQIRVYSDKGRNGDAQYFGFNNDGIWLSNPDLLPKTSGKPFTVRIVDGKAVFELRDKFPKGLRNATSDYLEYIKAQEKASAPSAATRDQSGAPAAGATAQAKPQSQDANASDASNNGRAPGFPESIQTGYIPVADNDLGITAVYLNYPDDPNAQPQVRVRTNLGAGDALYYGFNNEGIWLIEDLKVPKSGGKPFTMKIVDGKAVFQLQPALPRGLKNPTNDYLAMGLGDEKPAASPNKGTRGSNQPKRPGILNNPDVTETPGTVGHRDTTSGRPATIGGTKATVDASGLLTFQGSDNKSQSYKVERVSKGTQEPGKPLMGAYLYTAPDGKSGILFTLMGTPDGKVSGMPLNEQALAMLKPK